MQNPQPSKSKDKGAAESIFQRLRIALLDEDHWSYLQKRYHMTPREVQVAKLVCQGFNNNEIAKALKIKLGTVKAHLRSIYRRAHTNNRIRTLLKFVNTAAKFSAKSGITPPIPIVDIKKPVKKRSASAKIHKKGK